MEFGGTPQPTHGGTPEFGGTPQSVCFSRDDSFETEDLKLDQIVSCLLAFRLHKSQNTNMFGIFDGIRGWVGYKDEIKGYPQR